MAFSLPENTFVNPMVIKMPVMADTESDINTLRTNYLRHEQPSSSHTDRVVDDVQITQQNPELRVRRLQWVSQI